MFGDRIRELRKSRYMTQQDLANTLGVERSSISKYEKGAAIPSDELKIKLANLFDVSIDYILGREEQVTVKPQISPAGQSIPVAAIVSLPVVGTVKCGPGGLAYQDVEGYVQAANVKHPDECFYLRVTGDSMEPQITEGDLALIRRQPEVESGELAVVVVNSEEGTLKKVLFKDGAVILQAFNPKYPPRVFTGDAINSLTIVGKVIRTEKEW